MNICILIPTYKRNNTLIRLLMQLNDTLKQYRGPNQYRLCVTDSELANPKAEAIAGLCFKYVRNQGQGFDDNLFFFYRDHLAEFDYVLSISDDDVFSLTCVNPFMMIDAAVDSGQDAILFNHISYFSSKDGLMLLTGRHYQDDALTYDGDALRRHIMGLLPRHVGLIYSRRLVQDKLAQIATFRGTYHLYAVPYLLELDRRAAVFIDYPLFYFKAGPQKDGAWEDQASVFNGLALFLKQLKPCTSADGFALAQAGFLQNYLGDASAFRQAMVNRGCQSLRTEAQILAEVHG